MKNSIGASLLIVPLLMGLRAEGAVFGPGYEPISAFGLPGDCNGNGVSDTQDIADGTSTDFNSNGTPDECESVLFVDSSAQGVNDGSSWADAFLELQSALAVAAFGDFIWIAEGRYEPDFDIETGQADGDRTRSFELVSGIKLLGGFAGGETSAAQRDLAANVVLISGDIGVPGDASDNSYHILTGSNLDSTTLLDGCVIVGGQADAPIGSLKSLGAGLFLQDSDLLVRDCTFLSNTAVEGGAIWSRGGDLICLRCSFVQDTAELEGGGVYCRQGALKLINCGFVRCSAGNGAAVFCTQASFELTNGVVRDSLLGPALRLEKNSSGTLRGTTVFGSASSAASAVNGSSFDLRSCIVWGNDLQFSGGSSASFLVRHSNVQVPVSGTGNISVDPQFVNESSGDLRLSSGSPCIDAGANGVLPPDEFDLDGDGNLAEFVSLDFGGKPRRIDDPATPDSGQGAVPVTDMGAFEFQLEPETQQ